MLGELWASRMVLLQSSSDSFKTIWGPYCRIEVLPKKVALCFFSQCRGVLLSAKGALRIPVNCYDTAGSRHFKLEVGIVWYRIESSECGSSEQCMIATPERDGVKD